VVNVSFWRGLADDGVGADGVGVGAGAGAGADGLAWVVGWGRGCPAVGAVIAAAGTVGCFGPSAD
jgi:hypothetical protein